MVNDEVRLIEVSGFAVVKTGEVLPVTAEEPQATSLGQLHDDDDTFDNEAQAEPVKTLKAEASFDSITVWGHDRLPTGDDNFVKGIEEWITFAEAVCTSPSSFFKAEPWRPQIHLTQTDETQPLITASG